MKNFNIIIFLGVDGSGKSTLINAISNSNKKNFIQYTLFLIFLEKIKNQLPIHMAKKKEVKYILLLKLFIG